MRPLPIALCFFDAPFFARFQFDGHFARHFGWIGIDFKATRGNALHFVGDRFCFRPGVARVDFARLRSRHGESYFFRNVSNDA